MITSSILVVWYGMQCICFALISSLRDAKHERFYFPTGCKVFERSLEVTSTKSKCVSVFQCIVWFSAIITSRDDGSALLHCDTVHYVFIVSSSLH